MILHISLYVPEIQQSSPIGMSLTTLTLSSFRKWSERPAVSCIVINIFITEIAYTIPNRCKSPSCFKSLNLSDI